MQAKFVKALAGKLEKLDYATRYKILREAVQHMNERAEASRDMHEIAAFLVNQLGCNVNFVIATHDNPQAGWAPPPK